MLSVKDQLIEELDDTMHLYMDSQIERINSIDKIYYAIEMSVDPIMKEVLEEMIHLYEVTGHIDFDLKSLSEDDMYLDLYIIDNANTIVKSTEEIDLGLQFEENDFLSEVRKQKVYMTDRVTYQTRTLKAKKYAYWATPDNKYIFEAGYHLAKYSNILNTDSFERYSSDAIQLENSITDVILYSYHLGKSFNTSDDISAHDNPLAMPTFLKAAKTGQIESYKISKDNYDETHLFKGFYRKDSIDDAPFIIVELIYNNQEVVQSTNRQLAIQVILILIFLLVFVSFQVFLNNNFIRPINKLLIALNKVSNHDFNARFRGHSAYREVRIAGNAFNTMVTNVQNLLIQQNDHHKQLEEALNKNRKNYFQTIRVLVNAIDAKDKYTAGHCERVTKLAMLLAEYMDLNEDQKESLLFGSILHDIGKIGIDDSILKKKDRLSSEEYDLIKTHPIIGSKIINDIEFLNSSRDIIHYHHERIDGQGYPQGLSKDAIPLLTRIVTIVDAFDAMTSKRVYRKNRFTVEEAFEEMRKHSDKQFDQILLENFIEAYQKRYGPNLSNKADSIEIDNGSIFDASLKI